MRLKIFSDVHLEFGPFATSVENADVIIAAGDIGVQLSAIEWLNGLGKPVIYVAGNHEYWEGDLKITVEKIREACENSNVHFLEQESVVIGGVHFLGCTLWTDFANSDAAYMEKMQGLMNDFQYISKGKHKLKPEDLANLNRESKAWLRKSIKSLQGENIVVVTHHAPAMKSWGFENKDVFKKAYCNNMEAFINKNPVSVWVHGHVHDVFDYKVGDTRILCNARGYYEHGLVKDFVSEKIVEI